MTASTGIPGLNTGDEPRCTDPAELRKRASDARGRAALLRLQLMGLDREADQLEHEARLWDVADAAEAALDALRQKAAGLKAAEEGTLAAERQAQDKLRDDKRHLSRRKGEATRAQSASRDAQDEAAVRLRRSEQRVADAEKALAEAVEKHQAAERALESHEAADREASAAYGRAMDAGFSPGIAPRTSPIQVSLGRPEDLTDAEKRLLAPYASAVLTTGGGQRPAQLLRERRTTNAGFAAQDPSGFRMIRQGNHMIAVPPDPMPAPGRR